ncbi:MAG TPA: choice-of-anchor Q domain-containing protein, partial [Verrucomicrobiae bacterium]|nr:choice-of-anchor Q domain-containing protein [Verrucomicrobiae bacterium]
TGGTGGDGANALAGSNGNGGDGGNGGSASGGAIYNSATGRVAVHDCTFTNNTVAGARAGVSGFGSGGLGFDGANGFPGAGNSGAIYNDGGSLTGAFSTFNNNSASGAGGDGGTDAPLDADGMGGRAGSSANGGGIFNNGGIVALTNCTFAVNSVTGGDGGDGGNGGTVGFGGDGGNGGAGGSGNGGGLYNSANGTALIVNCTFSLNQSTGGTGGSGGAAGSTVARSGQTGAPGESYGSAIANSAGSVTLKNTILAYGSPGINAAGTILDGGNNLSSDATPAFTSPASRANTDPLVLPLANYGGTNWTAALAPNSPAIDQGNDAACPPTDQRHFVRVGQSDIGAYEFTGTSATATLRARRQNNELIISWPTLFDYTLESTPDLESPNWTSVTNTRGIVSFEFFVTNSLDGFSRFYRLRQ